MKHLYYEIAQTAQMVHNNYAYIYDSFGFSKL